MKYIKTFEDLDKLSSEMNTIIQSTLRAHVKAMKQIENMTPPGNVPQSNWIRAAREGTAQQITAIAEGFINEGECTLEDWLTAFKDYDYIIRELLKKDTEKYNL